METATPDAPASDLNPTETQGALSPELTPPRIEALDKVGLQIKKKRDRIATLQGENKDHFETVQQLMKEHGLVHYPIPDTELEVVLENKESVSVRKRKE